MSLGRYKGLDEVRRFAVGDRVTILVETTIESVEAGAGGHVSVGFAGGHTIEVPDEASARRTMTDVTVRAKRAPR